MVKPERKAWVFIAIGRAAGYLPLANRAGAGLFHSAEPEPAIDLPGISGAAR